MTSQTEVGISPVLLQAITQTLSNKQQQQRQQLQEQQLQQHISQQEPQPGTAILHSDGSTLAVANEQVLVGTWGKNRVWCFLLAHFLCICIKCNSITDSWLSVCCCPACDLWQHYFIICMPTMCLFLLDYAIYSWLLSLMLKVEIIHRWRLAINEPFWICRLPVMFMYVLHTW